MGISDDDMRCYHCLMACSMQYKSQGQSLLSTVALFLMLLLLPHAMNCRRFCFSRCKSVGFLLVYDISWGTAEQICTKFTRKMCFAPCSDEFEGQRSWSSGSKNVIFGPFGGLHAVSLVKLL